MTNTIHTQESEQLVVIDLKMDGSLHSWRVLLGFLCIIFFSGLMVYFTAEIFTSDETLHPFWFIAIFIYYLYEAIQFFKALQWNKNAHEIFEITTNQLLIRKKLFNTELDTIVIPVNEIFEIKFTEFSLNIMPFVPSYKNGHIHIYATKLQYSFAINLERKEAFEFIRLLILHIENINSQKLNTRLPYLEIEYK